MRGAPKVTVFIPVYNRARYLPVAVNSILAQTFTDFELLLIDDGSSDGSLELMQRYAAADPRIRVLTNGRNLGIPGTRNRGLQAARGEYIALLDSDDYAYPSRLAAQVRFLDRHPDHVQVGSWGSFMDADGRLLRRLRRQPTAAAEVDAELLFRCCLSNRSIMARTAVLRTHGYREDFPRCQDYELHARLAVHHRMANLPAVLVCGRQHPGRYTAQTAELGRERKMAISRVQLERLGLAPSRRDLENHHRLARPGAAGALAADDLDWAEDWLAELLAANRRVGRYRQPALAQVVARRWIGLCWRARGSLGAARAARMLRSPLVRMISPGSAWRSLAPVRPPPLRLDLWAPAGEP